MCPALGLGVDDTIRGEAMRDYLQMQYTLLVQMKLTSSFVEIVFTPILQLLRGHHTHQAQMLKPQQSLEAAPRRSVVEAITPTLSDCTEQASPLSSGRLASTALNLKWLRNNYSARREKDRIRSS